MRLIKPSNQSFDTLVGQFSWNVPEYFNIADVVCSRHARNTESADKTALICVAETDMEAASVYSFRDLERLSNRLAHLLVSLGCEPGERIAIILPQRLETALTHIAAHKIGAVSLPLAVLFGVDALRHRLQDSGARFVVTCLDHLENIRMLSDQLPELQAVLVCDSRISDVPGTGAIDDSACEHVSVDYLWEQLDQLPTAADKFEPYKTKADDPACLIYTSGTTGQPKGALLAHRTIVGNLPGFELSLNFFPQPDDVFFTPADWAWTGGLFDGLLPTLFYGKPIVGYDYRKFKPNNILRLLQHYQVTCGFFPPTALKMLRTVDAIQRDYQLTLRSLMSGGETLGAELISWARKTLGTSLNEMYGQTEHNFMIGNCSAILPVKPGSMGKAYPGHRVEVMRSDGSFANDGEEGELVAHSADAVHFLGYWQQPEATRKKYTDKWFHTGDVGYRDEEGYFWFTGRKDDVISSSGFRIGPGEIEDCILKHPAIAQVAVIGVPDPEEIRGDIVKAFVVLRDGVDATDDLASEIRYSVREQLSAHEYPRAIEFIESLPLTVTGKVRRIELREYDAKKRQ